MGGHADREFEETGPSEDAPSAGDDFEFFSAPGWYTIDYKRNVQAFWDGAGWSQTRRWRGVGWFEDDTASLLEPAVNADVLTGYGPASVVATAAGRSLRPPSLVRVGETSVPPPAPIVPRCNGTAIGSFVLATLGLFGVGSVLGIIYGFRARGEIRRSRGTQRGDRLALAGIIVGFCTLALFVVAVTFGILALAGMTSRMNSEINNEVGLPAQLSSQAKQTADLQCQADLRTVAIALTAYRMYEGAYPTPPKVWSASTYKANYADLTSGAKGGPWLRTAPSTDAYVIKYDTAGNVWVAPPGTYQTAYDPSQGLGSDSNACHVAVR
jgi:hypothetical protein